MIKTLLRKFSALLLRGHNFLDRRLSVNRNIAPKHLRFQPVPGKPKVFHFNGNFVVGGTSQLIADIIERSSNDYSHTVIVPNYPRPLPYQPVPIHEFPLANMQGLFDFLNKEKPALVHIHYWIRPMHRYFDFGLWYKSVFDICEELGLKVIQNIDVPAAPYKSKTVLHNVFVSNYVRDAFNDSNLPSSVIYPGSDLSHFSCPDSFSFPGNTIGMVYRLDTDKLNEKAIEVFISAVKKKPELSCFIIGGGYYLEYYRKRVREERMERKFNFTGFVSYDALPEYYKKIGLIVAPVHDESFGQVTPFAMSMGLPVAGYDTGAVAEILGSKEMLVPYGDTEALAALIADVMSNPEQRTQTGLTNKKRAHQFFSVEKMLQDYRKLYQQYIA